MTLPLIIVLAVIQGVTEFLPVSSSGHLVAYNELLSGKDLSGDMIVTFVIATHIGTLLAVLAVYRREVFSLFGADRRLIGPLFVATIPAVVIGLLVKQLEVADDLMNPILVGSMLIVTGLVLWFGDKHREKGTSEFQAVDELASQVSIKQSLVIGFCKAMACLLYTSPSPRDS